MKSSDFRTFFHPPFSSAAGEVEEVKAERRSATVTIALTSYTS